MDYIIVEMQWKPTSLIYHDQFIYFVYLTSQWPNNSSYYKFILNYNNSWPYYFKFCINVHAFNSFMR